MKKILLAPLVFLFGRFKWSPPMWVTALGNLIKNHIKTSLALVFTVIAAIVVYQVIDRLPKPIKVKASVVPLADYYPQNSRNSTGQNLVINFSYDFASINDDQVKPKGTPSVARIDLVKQTIKTGLRLSPSKTGQWQWQSDNSLLFIPETPWPTGVEYEVRLDKNIFAETVRLSSQKVAFTSPALNAKISSIEFYQDPQDSSIRRVISTVTFSHPVEAQSVKDALSMGKLAKKASDISRISDYPFTVNFSEDKLSAYIQSEPVELPKLSDFMKVILAPGVKSIFGGAVTSQTLDKKVLIPDLYSFLKIKNAQINIVRNQKNQPEQILTIEFTDPILQTELLNKMSVFLLVEDRQYWRKAGVVDQAVLDASQKIKPKLIPIERSSSTIYNFVIDSPEYRSIYLKLDENLTSVNKFVHKLSYGTQLRAPAYPKAVRFAGEGSILNSSGNHILGVITRGVPALRYSVGRLRNGNVNHLISQTRGDITNPSFTDWRFNESNIADFSTVTTVLEKRHPKEANYSSTDLTDILNQDTQRFGLFFIEAKAWDNRNDREIYGSSDKRLILITDLGIVVKNNANNSHNIFVQSITTGKPVVGAKVELLGANGAAVISGVTDKNGAFFIESSAGLTYEKKPTVYVVKTDNDMSFIPFDRPQRKLNLSKFDVGGVHTGQTKDTLVGYLFSDRGIYRPSETVNLGIIVKYNDMRNVEDVPLMLIITDPRGNQASVHDFNLDKRGFSEFQFNTQATTDTGSYTATLYRINKYGRRHEQLGYSYFKVEEFQPDTMKIISELENTPVKGWSTQTNINAKINLTNLFGTPAQKRKVSAEISVQPQEFRFKEYEDYAFKPSKLDRNNALKISRQLADKKTDDDGITNFDLDLSQLSGGTYALKFKAKGFDQAGGRSVDAYNSILVSPLEQMVGYKANGDLNFINANSERSIHFIVIDNELKQQQTSKLSLSLVEIQQISTLVKQPNGTYQYQTVKKETQRSTQALSMSNSGFNYVIDTAEPGDFALEVRNKNQQILSRVQYSVTGFGNLTGRIDKNAELKIKLNKPDYHPGEEIKLSIKAPYTGAGLITIESDKVHHFKWFSTQQKSSIQTINVPEDLEGTAYVNVSFVRSINSKDVFTSPLSYAVEPFSIDRSKRNVDIDLNVAELVRPGKPMDITLSTSKPSRVVIFAIDEGILQVADYQTPDPLSHYLRKTALSVETMQILDLILPDFNVVKELSASGGGAFARSALAKNLNPFARKLDKPAVYWSGIYDATDTPSNVTFDVPNTFSGQLRIMAVAVADDAFGATSESTVVRGPFVISPNVLTATAPGDEFDVTVGIANIIEGSGNAAPISVTVSSTDHLEIIGQSAQQLNIDEGGEGTFTFRVKTKDQLGAAELNFTAQHKDERLSRTTSLSVRPVMPYSTDIVGGYDKDGTTKIDLKRQLYANLADQYIAASASPLVVVDGLTSYLDTYPHGCTEQIVSKVFPIVGLLSHPAYAPHLENVQQQFDYLIRKLRSRQLSDGGFSFWPGVNVSADYPSIYVMHFLIEAQSLGYPVPKDMLNRGKNFLKNQAQRTSDGSITTHRDRANAIYLLTRLGVVTNNYLIDLEDNLLKDKTLIWQNDILASYMAATYKLLKKDTDASRLIKGYTLNSQKHKAMDDFHSLLAMDAQHVYLLAKHFEGRAKQLDGDDLLTLTDKIYRGEYNTISSAYSILALGAYSKIALNGDFVEQIDFAMRNINGKTSSLSAQATPFLTTNYPVEAQQLSLSADKPLFYLNVQSGFDKTLPSKAVKSGIEIYRDFIDDNGNIITQFEQGKEITVRLKVRALGDKTLNNIAIVDLLPGGFEVIRNSVPRTAKHWRADYVDVREDRVIYYASIQKRVTELNYRVKLSASGEFIIPPTMAESMYDRSIKAYTAAGKFTVTPSN